MGNTCGTVCATCTNTGEVNTEMDNDVAFGTAGNNGKLIKGSARRNREYEYFMKNVHLIVKL